jgi:protoheme IX farnesyltransferase
MLRDLLSLTKPGVTVQCAVTTAGAMALAGWPDAPTAAAGLLGSTLVVGSANALNCYLERDSDALMTRTRNRPLAARRLSPRAGLAFGLGIGALSIPLLALAGGALCALLGALALVTYVGVYTPMKRRSALALPIGAVPGAVPPLLGWTAATGSLDPGGLALFAVLFLWQHPHFVAIALRRHAEYANAGLHTVVGALGAPRAARLGIASVWLLVPVSLAPVPLEVAGNLYLAGASLLGAAWILRATAGWRTPEDPAFGRRFFGDSLLWLTALVGVLVVDVALA